MEIAPMKNIYPVLILLISFVLMSCSTNLPSNIRELHPDHPDILSVQQFPEVFVGIKTRWGGRIIEVKNLKQSSELIILGLELNQWGQPKENSEVQGRFIGVSGAFLDPAEFSSNRMITLYGDILRTERRKVGDFEYQYPIIQIKEKHLWPIQDKKQGATWNWSSHDRWMNREPRLPVIILHQ